MRLKRVDFPTFGRPMMATKGGVMVKRSFVIVSS
jgi:hypothetical protein